MKTAEDLVSKLTRRAAAGSVVGTYTVVLRNGETVEVEADGLHRQDKTSCSGEQFQFFREQRLAAVFQGEMVAGVIYPD